MQWRNCDHDKDSRVSVLCCLNVDSMSRQRWPDMEPTFGTAWSELWFIRAGTSFICVYIRVQMCLDNSTCFYCYITVYLWNASIGGVPTNTKRRPNAGLRLAQRRRRWANFRPTLGQRPVFARVCLFLCTWLYTTVQLYMTIWRCKRIHALFYVYCICWLRYVADDVTVFPIMVFPCLIYDLLLFSLGI